MPAEGARSAWPCAKLITSIQWFQPQLDVLIYSFITGRAISIRVNYEISDEVKLNAGIPQGSVLSPLWTFAPSNPFLALRLSIILAHLKKWCAKWRIKLNAKKTQLLLFKNSKRLTKKFWKQNYSELGLLLPQI